MKTKLFTMAIALFFVSASLRAAVLPGNIWHNPTFEAGSSNTPDFWNKGGNDPSVLNWTTINSVSPTHSLGINDNSLGYGEYYSDLPIVGLANVGDMLHFRWSEIFHIGTNAPDGNEMRVTIRFLDALGNGPDNHFVVSGNSAGWNGSLATSTFTVKDEYLTMNQTFQGPITTLRIAMVSGGNQAAMGQYIIDDLSVAVVPEPSTIALLSVAGLAGLSMLRRGRKTAC